MDGEKGFQKKLGKTAGRHCHLNVDEDGRPACLQDCLAHQTCFSVTARADENQMVVARDHLPDFRQFFNSVGEKTAVDDGAELERIFLSEHVRGFRYEKDRNNYNDEMRNENLRVRGAVQITIWSERINSAVGDM